MRLIAATLALLLAVPAFANPDLERADDLWKQRKDPAKLGEALASYEKALAAKPNDRYILGQLTRGWYFYGDAHSDDKTVKIERWGKAIAYGDQCLALNADYKARLDKGEKAQDAATSTKAEDVPCLYWTASALGKWGKAQSLSKTLKHVPTVKAYISQVEKLEPAFFHYGPARYWGAYYAVLPSFAGQDKVKSGEYFAASITGAPGYLGTYVLRAENLHVLNQDVEAFRKDLDLVIKADPNAIKGIEPENQMEQDKAKKLLAREAELFIAK
jgi:hypothetical protein